MFKRNIIFCLIFVSVFLSCSSGAIPPAKKLGKVNLVAENKKQGFTPLKHSFTCDSLNIKTIIKGNLIEKLTVFLGDASIDTIHFIANKVPTGAEKRITIIDFNFDGFCDFILSDELSASHGGMNYYFFLYDNIAQGYTEVKSLPKFNGGFKMDIKNQRVKIYCPYQDCFAYYKQQETGDFKLVKGEFKVEP